MEASSSVKTCEICMKGWEDDFIPDDQFNPEMFAAFEQTYEPEDTVLVAPSEAEPSPPEYKLESNPQNTNNNSNNNNNPSNVHTASSHLAQSTSSASKPRRIWGQGCLHQADLRILREMLGKQATLQELHDEVFRRLQLHREYMTPEDFDRMMDMDDTFELKHIEGVPPLALEEAKFLVFLKWKEFSDTVQSEWDVVMEEEDWDDVKTEEGEDDAKDKERMKQEENEEGFVSRFEDLKVDAI